MKPPFVPQGAVRERFVARLRELQREPHPEPSGARRRSSSAREVAANPQRAPQLEPARTPLTWPAPALYTQAARAWDAGEDLLLLAAEIVRSASDEALREPLGLLAFAVLLASHSGSTRASAGPEELQRLLAPLGVEQAVLRQMAALVRDAGEGRSPEPTLLAPAGAYAPLIATGKFVASQKLLAAEEQLAREIRARCGRDAEPLHDHDHQHQHDHQHDHEHDHQHQHQHDHQHQHAHPPHLSLPAVTALLTDLQQRPAILRGAPLLLSLEQRAAITAALTLPFVAISGGPGTGKTSIVVSIVRALIQSGLAPTSLALAAPTGKAAHRLGESLRQQLASIANPSAAEQQLLLEPPEPRTLHRLLGYSPARDRFAHHQNSRLAEQVVIVDEGSMIDLLMMGRLLRALRPGARLVLLGDAQQLPSVDAGAVFRDLIPAPDAPARDLRWTISRRLEESHRMDPRDPQGRAVLGAARAIERGDASAPELRPTAPRAAQLAFSGFELLDSPSPAELPALLRRWFDERISPPSVRALGAEIFRFDEVGPAAESLPLLEQLFAQAERHRLLALTRDDGSPTCARSLNAWFHAQQAELLGEPDARAFVPGDQIIATRNDYQRGLFNGDQGLVLRVRSADGLLRWCAIFRAPSGFRAIPLDAVRAQLELGYALTVHKAQGSEHDGILLVLPERDLPLLTRELLYTALTRGRRFATVAGQRALLSLGISRPLDRQTGLGSLLGL